MSEPLVDTDIIIRLVTGDDRRKQAAAEQLFSRVERGELTLAAPVTVVFDALVSGVDTIRAATSTDGGETWAHPVNINTFEGTGLPDERTGGLPSATIDPVARIERDTARHCTREAMFTV